jgi:hypothetical protein
MYEVLKRGALIAYLLNVNSNYLIKWLNLCFFMGQKWGFSKSIDCLEKNTITICKLLLKLKLSTPTYMIYGELGRFPIEIDIIIRMVLFWARLILG